MTKLVVWKEFSYGFEELVELPENVRAAVAMIDAIENHVVPDIGYRSVGFALNKPIVVYYITDAAGEP